MRPGPARHGRGGLLVLGYGTWSRSESQEAPRPAACPGRGGLGLGLDGTESARKPGPGCSSPSHRGFLALPVAVTLACQLSVAMTAVTVPAITVTAEDHPST